MYVLDTNSLIYFFKGMGGIADRLLSCSPKDIGIPSIVLYELQVGIAKSNSPKKRTQQLHELSSLVRILPFTDKEAKLSAETRVKLENQDKPIGPYDLLIAGTTLAQGGILITRNSKEFKRVPGLSQENWY